MPKRDELAVLREWCEATLRTWEDFASAHVDGQRLSMRMVIAKIDRILRSRKPRKNGKKN